MGLIIKDGMGPLPPPPRELNPVINIGTWIRLISDRDDSFEALVGEEADRPWGARSDPTNPFVAKALGLQAGGSFEHVTASGLRETWTVKEVKPRWLQAFHYLAKDFGRRFPNAHGFLSMTVDEGNIEPVLEQVRRHSEALSHQADLYLVNSLPIALAAGDRPGGAIAFADYLTSIGEDLHVCYGAKDELSEALALIGHYERSGAVLDAVTAWYAAGLGVFPILEERLGPLAIPRSEFARIQEMVARLGNVPDEETMTLTYQGGQYVERIITPEVQARRREEFQSRLRTIEQACAVESAVIPEGLPDLGDQLLNVPFGDAFVPAVIARSDRLFLTEDMMMRQLAARAFGTNSVWLQPVLLSAIQAETMEWGDYCEALVQLAAHRHGPVFVNAQVLFTVFEHDTSTELVKLGALCTYVGAANAEHHPLVASVAAVVNAIWVDAEPPSAKVKTATNLLFRTLLVCDDGTVYAERTRDLARQLGEAPKTYLGDWLDEQAEGTGSGPRPGGAP